MFKYISLDIYAILIALDVGYILLKCHNSLLEKDCLLFVLYLFNIPLGTGGDAYTYPHSNTIKF